MLFCSVFMWCCLIKCTFSPISVQPCIMMHIFLTIVGLKLCDVFSRLEREKNRLMSVLKENATQSECLLLTLYRKMASDEQ